MIHTVHRQGDDPRYHPPFHPKCIRRVHSLTRYTTRFVRCSVWVKAVGVSGWSLPPPAQRFKYILLPVHAFQLWRRDTFILYRRHVLVTAAKSFKGKNATVVPLPDVKAYREAEVWLYSSLTSALDRGWMASLTPRPSYPKEIVIGAHWIRGWMGSTAIVYCCRRDQSLAPAWIQTPDWYIC